MRHSHPQWVVTALRAALLGHGRATPATVDAELAALLTADNEPPHVHLVARPGLTTVDELLPLRRRRAQPHLADRHRAAAPATRA